MPSTVAGRFDEVVLAKMDPDEDLLIAIREVCTKHQIKAGVVLSIVGGVTVAKVSHFKKFDTGNPRVVAAEYQGPMEISAHGILGIEEDGSPYVHVHVTFTTAEGETVVGHLVEGTKVRSLLPGHSHFTIAIGRLSGVELRYLWDRDIAKTNPEFAAKYPEYSAGYSYHEIAEV
jgi:predicted DNA-binding protein with PD1-like motif